ncbi:MAG: hypothetical protein FWG05_02930 [Kiritimatiellaeota bacterium]|nr:hypothetical protein [Kiritimatiellota bacterium]
MITNFSAKLTFVLFCLALAGCVSPPVRETAAPDKMKIIETFNRDGAVFEIVEIPETIYAGKAFYSQSVPPRKDDINADAEQARGVLEKITHPLPSAGSTIISVNFWKHNPEKMGLIFVRETLTARQPEGVDVFVMPASLFIRGRADAKTARLLGKTECEPWELFAFMRYNVMPGIGYEMADNGAQEIEIHDEEDRTKSRAYIPVIRKTH